ncbi:hypothetical protein BGZ83_011874 [Gryganskiella cystojenkinii]|nr:hypothetical protein BGZ83_011874 [Gryganskiella cystojenkinii]
MEGEVTDSGHGLEQLPQLEQVEVVTRSFVDGDSIRDRVIRSNNYDKVSEAVRSESMKDPVAAYLFTIVMAYCHCSNSGAKTDKLREANDKIKSIKIGAVQADSDLGPTRIDTVINDDAVGVLFVNDDGYDSYEDDLDDLAKFMRISMSAKGLQSLTWVFLQTPLTMYDVESRYLEVFIKATDERKNQEKKPTFRNQGARTVCGCSGYL